MAELIQLITPKGAQLIQRYGLYSCLVSKVLGSPYLMLPNVLRLIKKVNTRVMHSLLRLEISSLGKMRTFQMTRRIFALTGKPGYVCSLESTE
jgi:hypothetical protein